MGLKMMALVFLTGWMLGVFTGIGWGYLSAMQKQNQIGKNGKDKSQ